MADLPFYPIVHWDPDAVYQYINETVHEISNNMAFWHV